MSQPSAALKVVVLMGGPSAEAEVSRSSAAEVSQALLAGGHQVQLLELDTKAHLAIANQAPDVVFPVLHGPPGEDGTVQGLLEMLGIRYVGSNVHGSAVAMDKSLSKQIYRNAALPLAGDLMIAPDAQPAVAASEILQRLGTNVVVKPNRQGSAIGVTRVTAAAQLEPALTQALASRSGALVEEYIRGKEITVGVLDLEGQAAAPFPVVEVTTAENTWYDFGNRYAAGQSEHIIPAELAPDTNKQLQQIALQAHSLLGLRDLSRSDFIVTEEQQIVLLETNTLPGMTPTSLYPDAAKAYGLTFVELMDALVQSAMRRDRPVMAQPVQPAMPLPPSG